jgi:hypothetical protein
VRGGNDIINYDHLCSVGLTKWPEKNRIVYDGHARGIVTIRPINTGCENRSIEADPAAASILQAEQNHIRSKESSQMLR